MVEGTVERGERERDLDRFLTFIDAIVAIAITLLVLPLAELAPEVGDHGGVGRLLGDNSDLLWSFALSFYVIARLWTSQHHAVSPLLVGNGRITKLLLAWAFTIVVLPFPTSLVAADGEDPIVKTLYVGTMAVSILIISLIRAEIRSNVQLTDGSPYDGPIGGLVTAGLLVVALVVMLAVPATSYFPLLVLLLDGPVVRLLGRSGNRSSP